MRSSLILALALLPPFAVVSTAIAQDPPVVAADTTVPPRPADSASVPSVQIDSGALDLERVFAEPPALVPVTVTAADRNKGRYGQHAITSATRTALPLRDIPQSVTVINRALIADQGMQSMADVVRYVPGITMGQGEGHRDQPTIRGNSTTADFFIDGVRDDAQYFRDVYNVERVEALKGPNAMIFGRGGGGGVINRTMKEADWTPIRELMLQAGSFGNRRSTLDLGQGLTRTVAARLNAVYENSDIFRDRVSFWRHGLHPTATFVTASENTRATLGYENFVDHRTVDRGIPSFNARPLETGRSTFFGNPLLSYSDARVHSFSSSLAQRMSRGANLRNTTRFTSYRKFYQNIFPGPVSTDGANASLSAYNSSHERRNLLNQTDLTYSGRTGAVKHTVLLGAEVGRQVTENLRLTGFFNDASATVSVPVSDPISSTPVTFRASGSDADNHVTNTIQSIYAQDQIAFNEHLHLVTGVRYERFGIRHHDNRTNATLRRADRMISPRFGLVIKPATPFSLYATYSVSFLPSAGDQFSALTDVARTMTPERFQNHEIGAKWEIADRLALTTAFYALDRTNTRAPAPDNPSQTVQTGSQRSKGFELGLNGGLTPNWQVAGGFARQEALITSTTAAAPAGATVPLVPGTTLSLWNKYDLSPRLGLGLGLVHQTEMYAAIDNRVVLPAFSRVDAAVFFRLSAHLRAQVNMENVLDEKYYPLAHNNNNITPGSPRAVRVSLTSGF